MFVIGIAGGTGSGKTTFTNALTEAYKDDITVIHHDNYYKMQDHLTLKERAKVNYDHPDAYDTALMIEDIRKLKNGESVEAPIYDFTVHNRKKEETLLLEPKKILIIEGILIFENRELCDLMDLKIFIDTDADVRLGRRMLRDINERGRNVESVLNQYEATVKPMYDKYVDPSRKNADIVVMEGGKNKAALEVFLTYINHYLA